MFDGNLVIPFITFLKSNNKFSWSRTFILCRIIVVLNMEVLVEECEIIGSPPKSGFTSQKSSSEKISERQTGEPGNGASVGVKNLASQHDNKTQNFHPTVQPSYRPPAKFKSHGPIFKNEAPARFIPISALNPYQGRWAIKARVTAKGNLRRYNNAKGDGKVFSFDLLDSDGGEIRVTCFNSVVDRFYDVVEVGKVYLISKGNLKPAKKTFNHLNHDWEIFLEATSTVDVCPDEDSCISRQQFSFTPINQIENLEANSFVDVIGIVISASPSIPILRKNGMETQRKILNVEDASDCSVELTLWGDLCNQEGRELQSILDSGLCPVLAVKAGRVNDFSGKSVGTISSTQLFMNPDIPEAHCLRDWFDKGGSNVASRSISKEFTPKLNKMENRKTIFQIKDEGLGKSGKPDWVIVKATLMFVKTDNFCYTACPLTIGDRKCSKKVIRSGNGSWRCDRCEQLIEECDYRYLLQAQIQDHTGTTWVTAFQDSGEEILGHSARQLHSLKHEEGDDARFGEIIKSSLFKQYLFTLKINEESYGDERQVKTHVVKADEVDFLAESSFLSAQTSNSI